VTDPRADGAETAAAEVAARQVSDGDGLGNQAHMRTTRRFRRAVPEIPRSRRFVAQMLRSHGAEPTDELLLVASELVTNAVRHGRGDIELRVDLSGPAVRLEVLDDGHASLEEAVTDPPALQEGGRGLPLVSAVSERWGAGFDERGRTLVWAEIATARSAETAAAGG
jgi:anti-sigma regulatory factor (Ser/Thr protein kinase)